LKSCGAGAGRKIPTFPLAHSCFHSERFGRDHGGRQATRMLRAAQRLAMLPRIASAFTCRAATAFLITPPRPGYRCPPRRPQPVPARRGEGPAGRTLLRLDSTRSETGEILAPVARCSDRQPQRCVNKVCNDATNLLDAVLRMAPGIGARRAGSGPLSDDDGPGCDCCLDEWAGDLGTAFVRPAPSEAARNRGLIFGS
jgi:hypothetical protein